MPPRVLVPGDLIRIRLGDIVPADVRLLEGDPVEVDQSALTGESLPVTRKTGEALFSGSITRKGEATLRFTQQVQTPTSERQLNWSRRRTPSAISNVPCSRLATT